MFPDAWGGRCVRESFPRRPHRQQCPRLSWFGPAGTIFTPEDCPLRHPGATALFLILCGADQNPNPRGTVEFARKYGDALAGEVDRVSATHMTPVAGPIRTAFRLTPLQLAPRTRADFEAELKSTLPAQVRRAQMMLNDSEHVYPVLLRTMQLRGEPVSNGAAPARVAVIE